MTSKTVIGGARIDALHVFERILESCIGNQLARNAECAH